MTGTSSRHPAKGPERTTGGNGRKPVQFTTLARPGYSNACLCYILILSAFLSPLALIIAILFADAGPKGIAAHYFYIRTTVGLLVIGFSLGSLLIVLGASISTSLILAGLALLILTAAVTLARCLAGFFRALRGRSPRKYRSYFV